LSLIAADAAERRLAGELRQKERKNMADTKIGEDRFAKVAEANKRGPWWWTCDSELMRYGLGRQRRRAWEKFAAAAMAANHNSTTAAKDADEMLAEWEQRFGPPEDDPAQKD